MRMIPNLILDIFYCKFYMDIRFLNRQQTYFVCLF